MQSAGEYLPEAAYRPGTAPLPGLQEISAFAARSPINIVFLDIYMDDANGIDTAHILRRFNTTCALVFITSSPDFALDAFEVNACHYLIKPPTEDKLLTALQRAQRVQSRASRVGFDWNHVSAVMDKVEEELGEMREAMAASSTIWVSFRVGWSQSSGSTETLHTPSVGEQISEDSLRGTFLSAMRGGAPFSTTNSSVAEVPSTTPLATPQADVMRMRVSAALSGLAV